ncbi:homeobox protein 5-like [Copidosoma floridanum]|uniref:homeobox protein 5-like n=1 Tax=Copidosoma floridanum TaxID=29053 RepID=UPI0006C96EFB|nr:homeobox protein 5-like [Copidosoma floridanum]
MHAGPQNLVMMGNFPDCSVKLCDFEISRVILEGTDVREILGTPEYVAPEILHYEPITLAADMWSLGVTTYVLLTGFSPFGGETDQETLKNIIHGQVDFPEELFEDVSIQARDFVAKLLILEPSDRMTAKQCLQHEWLRSAPTQASSHLRKYLSKSRDVLLERVVSREHLRRTALLGQTYNTACSNNNNNNNNNNNLQLLLQDNQNNQNNNWTGLSQSEVCLSRGRLNGSNGSLSGGSSVGEDCWGDMIGSSRISLADSVSSNRSIGSSLGTSQSCLLNREQTEGLLSQAQDRSSMRASLAQSLNRVGLLSKIRSLNQVQSKSHMCLRSLLNGPAERDINQKQQQQQQRIMMGSCHFDGSREKLYGLKSLSKSQGMLDIYRSLESLQRQRRSLIRQRERSKTEDALVPFFRHLRHSGTSSASSLVDSTFWARSSNNNNNDDDAGNDQVQHQNSIQLEAAETASMRLLVDKGTGVSGTEMVVGGSEEKASAESNLDSLHSLESDTLTDDSEVTGLSRSPRNKQSSVGSECYVDSENEEPKFSVAQLVSAFSRHQKVASSTSLEALMTEGSTDFPIGPKALQLFVSSDIDASIVGSERTTLVRRKTSYKPRKDWEELRKQSEKNEALLDKKDFFNDSGNEDDAEFNNNNNNNNNNNVDDQDNKDKGKFACDGKKKEPLANSSINLERAVLRHKPESRTSNAINNNLASRISIFSSETRPSPSSTHHKTKSRLAVKEKLCTGSYGRALDKFSSKSGTADGIKPLQLPKSRRTTVKS